MSNQYEAVPKTTRSQNTGQSCILEMASDKKERSEPVTKAKKKASPSSPKNNSSPESASQSRVQSSAQEGAGTQSVDKIRDIIFGNQMQDYDKRFARLEDELHSMLGELRDATSKRLDSIESYIEKEIEALSVRLKAEQSTRDQTARKLSKESKDSMQRLLKDIEQLAERLNKDTRELRQQLLETTKNLSSEITEKQDATAKALKQTFNDLDASKVARTALSEILLELAVRTSNELAEKINLPTDDSKNG